MKVYKLGPWGCAGVRRAAARKRAMKHRMDRRLERWVQSLKGAVQLTVEEYWKLIGG